VEQTEYDQTIFLYFLKTEQIGYANLNLNTPITTVECSNETTITITITNKNYDYSNNYEIFIISDYISVYADHAIDKQISSKR